MAKIYNDKYYTPKNVVKKVIELVEQNIQDINSFDRVIEPSVGAGAFYSLLPSKTRLGYDIEPHIEDKSIYKGNYLIQDIPNIENSLVIGNPPFDDGTGTNNLHIKFIEKSLEHSQYVAFILPIDMFNKDNIKTAKLIHSYKLPSVSYSGVKLKTCINFYIRRNFPLKLKKIKDVDIVMFQKQKEINPIEIENYKKMKYDYRLIGFGSPRLLAYTERTKAKEYKITFKYKRNFEPILKKFLLKKSKNCISSGSISKQEIINLIYDTYPEFREN